MILLLIVKMIYADEYCFEMKVDDRFKLIFSAKNYSMLN
jgi:hypothetical protein